MPVMRIIAAILLPPLGVFLTRGITGTFWLSVVLTLIGFVPGVLHALFVVLTDQRATA